MRYVVWVQEEEVVSENLYGYRGYKQTNHVIEKFSVVVLPYKSTRKFV